MPEPMSYIPCTAWATEDDWCCPVSSAPQNDPCATPGLPPVTPVFDHATLLDMSSEMLYAATGWLFPGICTLTVEYPQQCDPCAGGGFGTGFGLSAMDYSTFGLVRQNQLGPCCRSCDPCRCLPAALTHYPMSEVVSITEDGVALNLATAKVQIGEYNHIMRCDGKAWAACKTVVEFKYGRTPPTQGRLAAAKLACALDAACNPDACFSNMVTGFTAAGRTYNLADIRQALAEGSLPIPEVQLFLGLYGGVKKNAYIGRVWTPDQARRAPRVVTWAAT